MTEDAESFLGIKSDAQKSDQPPNPESTPPETSPKTYRNYEDVPWYRRSGANTAFILTNMLTLGCIPLTLWTCINLLSGNVYYNKKDADGNLKTWSYANKVVAFIIIVINAVSLTYIVINAASPSH